MLHTKVRGIRSSDSGEDGFKMILPYMVMVAICVMRNFRSSYPWRLTTNFDFDWLSGFGGV